MQVSIFLPSFVKVKLVFKWRSKMLCNKRDFIQRECFIRLSFFLSGFSKLLSIFFDLVIIKLLTILLVLLIVEGWSESKKVIHILYTSFEQMID